MGCQLSTSETERECEHSDVIDIPVNEDIAIEHTKPDPFSSLGILINGTFQVRHEKEGFALSKGPQYILRTSLHRREDEAILTIERAWMHYRLRQRCKNVAKHVQRAIKEEKAASLLALAWRRYKVRRKFCQLIFFDRLTAHLRKKQRHVQRLLLREESRIRRASTHEMQPSQRKSADGSHRLEQPSCPDDWAAAFACDEAWEHSDHHGHGGWANRRDTIGTRLCRSAENFRNSTVSQHARSHAILIQGAHARASGNLKAIDSFSEMAFPPCSPSPTSTCQARSFLMSHNLPSPTAGYRETTSEASHGEVPRRENWEGGAGPTRADAQS